jgi:uncharacterized iron-regulated membrane protein
MRPVLRPVLLLGHRWLGALIGLGLAVLGLSGTLLLWKPFWVGVAQEPRAANAAEMLAIAEAAEALGARHVTLPSADFGVAQVGLGDGAGAYLSHDGRLLARWESVWERPETLLFDLHHHLLMGREGEIISGWLGLAAVAFVVSGLILWWPVRGSFAWRALPARLSRPAIIRHHRDLGVVLALPLLLAATTGALMVLKPLSEAALGWLSSPAAVAAWEAKPGRVEGDGAGGPDWPRVLSAAAARFPAATTRLLVWPRTVADPVQIRLRQPSEWHPNGRTTLWMAGTGQVLMARDAQAAPRALRAAYALYPLHSARMAESALALPLRIVLSLAGLGLVLLGSLTVLSFWRQRLGARTHPALGAG